MVIINDTEPVCAFQFQTGSIKRVPSNPTGRSPGSSFNSKLVRLKAGANNVHLLFKTSFNSKLVRLKAFPRVDCPHDNECFNSKLVRLKGIPKACTVAVCLRFQFQTGSIKSASPQFPRCQQHESFNSKLVRLKDEVTRATLTLTAGFNSKLVRLKENSGVVKSQPPV